MPFYGIRLEDKRKKEEITWEERRETHGKERHVFHLHLCLHVMLHLSVTTLSTVQTIHPRENPSPLCKQALSSKRQAVEARSSDSPSTSSKEQQEEKPANAGKWVFFISCFVEQHSSSSFVEEHNETALFFPFLSFNGAQRHWNSYAILPWAISDFSHPSVGPPIFFFLYDG